jgi:hypothetical protein
MTARISRPGPRRARPVRAGFPWLAAWALRVPAGHADPAIGPKPSSRRQAPARHERPATPDQNAVACCTAWQGDAKRLPCPLPLSKKTLNFTARIVRPHRKAIGSV